MRYLKGKRVRMIHMEDVDPIQPGQCGVVQFVDDLNLSNYPRERSI
jgi:hypothetical protein